MAAYHPAIVVLHWLLAALILFLLLLGGEMPLAWHLILGLLVGGLFALRLAIKYRAGQPDRSGNPLLNRLASTGHKLLYLLVFAVVLSGFGVMAKADLLQVVQSQQPLPPGFSEFAILQLHKCLQQVLLMVICAHIGAALFHQLMLADGVFARIWFARK